MAKKTEAREEQRKKDQEIKDLKNESILIILLIIIIIIIKYKFTIILFISHNQ